MDGQTAPWTPDVVVRAGPSGFRTEVEAGAHRLAADEPASLGGTDTGPGPYDYLTAAVGACTAMTMRMYADRKGWPLEGVTIRLRHSRVHRADCERCESERVGVDRIEREIELAGPLTAEQRERLVWIADRCPVKQTLARGVEVVPAPAG